MKRILQYSVFAIAFVAADDFELGSSAMTALQEYNFALEYNIFTTGGAITTF